MRETFVTSAVTLPLALAVFWYLGAPGDFDASEKITAINQFFDISLLLFLPLLVVAGLALVKMPPFTTILLGALVSWLFLLPRQSFDAATTAPSESAQSGSS